MMLWPFRIAIAALLAASAAIAATAFVPSWDRTLSRAMASFRPPPEPTPARYVAPNEQRSPKRCRDKNAVSPLRDEQEANEPTPELSIRTTEKIGRSVPVDVALLVDTQGNVTCAEAVFGHTIYHARAEALAMKWRFKPFRRDNRPVMASLTREVPVRWPERRPATHTAFPTMTDRNTLRITLRRTMCHGVCPQYDVEIRGDGTVAYRGHAFVALSGSHRATVTTRDVDALLARFSQVNFFWLHDAYISERARHGPATNVSVKFDNHEMTVHDAQGLHVGMPDAVRDIQKEIDRIAGTERWTIGNAQTAPSLIAERWNTKSRSSDNLSIPIGVAVYGDADTLRSVIALGIPLAVDVEFQYTWGAALLGNVLEAAALRGDAEILKVVLESSRALDPGTSWRRLVARRRKRSSRHRRADHRRRRRPALSAPGPQARSQRLHRSRAGVTYGANECRGIGRTRPRRDDPQGKARRQRAR